MSDNKCDCVCYEANFELASAPIEVNLELKTYQEKDSDLILFYFSKKDWNWAGTDEEKLWSVDIDLENYKFKSCALIDFQIYNSEEDTYHSALCDYTYSRTNNTMTLYTADLIDCKASLFGVLDYD